MACKYQFSGGRRITSDEIWSLYLERKQTIFEISSSTGVSDSTVKRRLKEITIEWKQPRLSGHGTIHIDATYFGRNTGVLLALESGSGRLLYMEHIAHEHISDYETAVNHIKSTGYVIDGIVIDGLPKLFEFFSEYLIQMCQFHMVAIIRRKLTKNPQLAAGKELLDLAYRLKDMTRVESEAEFKQWKK